MSRVVETLMTVGAVSAAVVLLCGCAPPQVRDTPHDDALPQRVDSPGLATLESEPMAGLAVAVAQDGQRRLETGYGLADPEHDVPVVPETLFRIGSVTNQFTPGVVMQLVEEGALELDDPIDSFLPDYVTKGARITVRRLLTPRLMLITDLASEVRALEAGR